MDFNPKLLPELPLPLLSFCLPTYNRAALLSEALAALCSQVGPEEAERLEVLVVDNASPDRTAEVVAECGARWPHVPLRYLQNSENIGADRNFLKAVALARGTFVLLISDDDILLPGAVVKLLGLIQKHPHYDGFCLNVRSFARDPYDARAAGPFWLKLTEDTTLMGCDDVLLLIRGYITFMSIVAFNKSRLLDNLASQAYEDKIGTYFLQCYLFLDALAPGRGFVATSEPFIAQRIDNAHGLNFFQVFVTEFHALMAHAEKIGYSRQAVLRSKNENLVEVRNFLSRVFIYNRQKELWSSRRDGIARLFRAFGFRPYLWLAVVPLMFFPRPLRPVWYAVRRLLGRAEVEIGQDAGANKHKKEPLDAGHLSC